MINTLIGKKLTMTHTYDELGRWVAVTRLELGPCTVSQVKTKANDGYAAVQLVYGAKKHMTNPIQGHLKKGNIQIMPRFINEVANSEGVNVGDKISVSDVFHSGDVVKATGFTRGRGFTGVVKRWGFAGGPKTHGQSDRHRAPGSIGQGTTPGRIHKGKKMAGRHGQEKKSISNLRVVKIDGEKNQLWLSGAVPGHPDSKIIVTVLKPSLAEAKS